MPYTSTTLQIKLLGTRRWTLVIEKETIEGCEEGDAATLRYSKLKRSVWQIVFVRALLSWTTKTRTKLLPYICVHKY